MTKIEIEHLPWCTSLFDSLAEGGKWGVPRSGLIFTKIGDRLVLTDKMPWEPGMPLNEESLLDYQDEEYESIRTHFGAAGITVRRASASSSG